MRPAFNFELKYRVTMLTREEWSRAPVVKGLVCFTVGSRMKEGNRARVYEKSVGRRLSISLGRYYTVFQAEIYAVLDCANEIQLHGRPEKHMNIRSDSQVALKALQPTRTSPLVQQCQKALNDVSTQHAMGLCWVP